MNAGDGIDFGPLSEDERAAAGGAGAGGAKPEPRPVIPVPDDAGEPDWPKVLKADGTPSKRGKPDHVRTYVLEGDKRAGLIARWDARGDRKKTILPVTWCRWPDGSHAWTLKAMPAPRVLYRLPALLKNPDKPVLLVEGEGCADAAAAAFPDHVATTWAGGCGAGHLADFSPLKGRTVLLVADADDPGRRAMRDIGARLVTLGCAVRVFAPPGDDGDDIADWLRADGVEATRAHIEDGARVFEPPADGGGDAAGDGGDRAAALVEAAKTDRGAPFKPANRAWLATLRRDDQAAYETLRGRLADETKVRVGELDKAVARAAGDDVGDGLQGRPVEYDDPEPWPDPVDGAALLGSIAAFVRRFVDMPAALADVMALWVLHTWMHDRPELEISTFLRVTSATKRCGKSLLMEAVGALVFRPFPTSGRVTPAVLFRLIQRDAPTLLLDEADTFFGDDPELRGVVNGSQRRGSAYVPRTVGDDYEPRRFGTWCPKAIAGIGDLPPTVVDRAITIRLERRDPSAGKLPKWRDRDRDAIADMRRKIAGWVQDHADAALKRRNDVVFPPGVDNEDRACDAWEVLLAIGDEAGGEWAGVNGRAYRAAVAINADTEGETGAREQLLADLHAVFEAAGKPDALPTGTILEALHVMEGRPWSEWRRGKPLSSRGLSGLLKDFRIHPGTIRDANIPTAGGTAKGYARAKLEPVWARYSIGQGSLSVTPSQSAVTVDSRDSQSVTSPNGVTDRNLPKPAVTMNCDGVTDTTRGRPEGRRPNGPAGDAADSTEGDPAERDERKALMDEGALDEDPDPGAGGDRA